MSAVNSGEYNASSSPGATSSKVCQEKHRHVLLTLSRLLAFTPEDYEAYRARGKTHRHRLCCAVLNALNPGQVWRTDEEIREEWGGVFPVHLRLTHRNCRHVQVDILSPGRESPFWHGLMWLTPDHTGLYFWNDDKFDPLVVRTLLQEIDDKVRDGVKPADIVSLMRREGVR